MTRGSPKDKPFRDALRQEQAYLRQCEAEGKEPQALLRGTLRWNARQLLTLGDAGAIREVADRLDGRVPQSIGGSEELPALQFQAIERVIVDPVLAALEDTKTIETTYTEIETGAPSVDTDTK